MLRVPALPHTSLSLTFLSYFTKFLNFFSTRTASRHDAGDARRPDDLTKLQNIPTAYPHFSPRPAPKRICSATGANRG